MAMLKVIDDDNVMIYNVMMLMVLASLAKEWECFSLISRLLKGPGKVCHLEPKPTEVHICKYVNTWTNRQ